MDYKTVTYAVSQEMVNPRDTARNAEEDHTSDLKIGTLVVALPGSWRYRVSTRTGWPGPSVLLEGEIASWICNFYLSVVA